MGFQVLIRLGTDADEIVVDESNLCAGANGEVVGAGWCHLDEVDNMELAVVWGIHIIRYQKL